MAIKFDVKTGLVFVRNFDQGVVETLGGYLDYDAGAGQRNYFIDISAADPMKVPIIFNKPNQVYENKIYPCILITRGNATPDLVRWHSVGAMQYRIPNGNPESMTLDNGQVVSGYDAYEMLVQAFPYNLPYTISMMARTEHEVMPILKKVLSVYKPVSKILIKDSLSAVRSYSVFVENGWTDISELIDIADRMKGYAVDIRVEGELDLSDPEINVSTRQIVRNHTPF